EVDAEQGHDGRTSDGNRFGGGDVMMEMPASRAVQDSAPINWCWQAPPVVSCAANRATPARRSGRGRWQLQRLAIAPDLIAALAWRGSPRTIRLEVLASTSWVAHCLEPPGSPASPS